MVRVLVATLVVGYSFGAMAAIDRIVTVSGECTRTVVPDRGAVILTAVSTDKVASVANQKASEIYETLRKEILKLKLPQSELSTSEMSVDPIVEWVGNREVKKGFNARMGLRVTTSEPSKLGEVVALGGRIDIRDIGNLELYVSTEKMRAERGLCLQAAAENAKAKAEKLAASLGAKLGEVATISENQSNSGGIPIQTFAKSALMAAERSSAVPHVEASNKEIQVSVTASFFLK